VQDSVFKQCERYLVKYPIRLPSITTMPQHICSNTSIRVDHSSFFIKKVNFDQNNIR
jgi:hypothetical protein